MDKSDPIPPTFKPRRFHWYIRRKDLDELNHTYDQTMEPSTSHDSKASIQPTLRSGRSDSMADYRFCGGGVSAKYLTNMIVIALIQEITVGLIYATSTLRWFEDPRLVVLAVCRILQIVPCFVALAGNYKNNATLLIPFMLSQISLGSYADLSTYMMLVTSWQSGNASSAPGWFLSSPLFYMVIPILIYACLLVVCIYVTNQSIKFVNMKKLSISHKNTTTDTQIVSLI